MTWTYLINTEQKNLVLKNRDLISNRFWKCKLMIPVVIVDKKDDSKRFCVNYGKLKKSYKKKNSFHCFLRMRRMTSWHYLVELPYGRFPLPIRSTRSSDRGLVELIRQEWSGWSTLLGIAPASYRKILDMSKNSSRDREAKRSRSHREVIGYWLSRGRVDRETFFTIV